MRGMSGLSIDELTEVVIGCAMAVHRALGLGLLESVYRDCLVIELQANGLAVEVEKFVSITYRDQRVRSELRIDILVDARFVVKVKAVERLHPVHQAQVITYLKLSGCPAGLLFNFNALNIRGGLKRVDRPDVYAQKRAQRLGIRRPE